MEDNEVTVVAVFSIKPGEVERFTRAASAVVQPTRGEDGCLTYELHHSRENPASFMFFEKWRSRRDLDRHLESPHIVSFLAEVNGTLERDIEVSHWETLA